MALSVKTTDLFWIRKRVEECCKKREKCTCLRFEYSTIEKTRWEKK